MAKSTFSSRCAAAGIAALALSFSTSALQAQTQTDQAQTTAPTPGQSSTTTSSATGTTNAAPISAAVVLPPKVPRKLRYVKLKNAPARQVALQLGWLNSGPSYTEASLPSTVSESTTTGSTTTAPATPQNSAPQRGRLTPEVLYFVPVESQNAITFFADDEEAKTLTEEIRALDVPQPKLRIEVRVYEPKTPEDASFLFASAQPGTAESFLRPIEESILTERGNLVASQTLETTGGATVDLSTEKLLEEDPLNWQLQTNSTPDGALTLRVTRAAQIQTVQNVTPIQPGQLLALSTDQALQNPETTRQLVVFIPTLEAPKTTTK